MSYYEYRVVPAVKEAPRAKGVKGTEARFALAMQEALNAEGLAGWEFQRAETLTVEAKTGLLRKATVAPVTVMIYRRWVDTDSAMAVDAGDMSGTWQPPLAREEPDTPETLGAQIARQADAGTERGLTASRRPEGDLRPVPGAGRR